MRAEDRIFWLALAVGAAASGWTGWWKGAAVGVALATGVGLALVNYAWLRAGANALVGMAEGGTATRGATWGGVRFVLRIGLLVACVYAIFISHLLPIAWVVAGLFAVPAGAVLEAVAQLVQLARHA